MRNIKLTIKYDGGRYDGWQRLKGESKNTIELKLNEVLNIMTSEKVELICGARTETGVHAYAQVVNFKTNVNMDINEIKFYLNRYLPTDIAVMTVEEVDERFHSAYNAKSKKYLYRIAIGDVSPVFERKYMYYCFKKLDIAKMKEASKLLLGVHDFKAFSSIKKTKKSTERKIYDIEIYGDSSEIEIIIEANDFLHNMARIIVGVLIEIGRGDKDVTVIDDLFNGKIKNDEIEMAEAKGLYLQEINY